jgi:hypothetical protein
MAHSFKVSIVLTVLALFALILFANALPSPSRLSDYDAGEIETPTVLQPHGPNPEDDFTGSNEATPHRKIPYISRNLRLMAMFNTWSIQMFAESRDSIVSVKSFF